MTNKRPGRPNWYCMKYAFDALEKDSVLLCKKNGIWCFESVKDG